MIRYINYVLTAIMIMLVLPFVPVLAVAAIPIAFIYYMIEPRADFFHNFSLRRTIRRIGFKPPKKALALYIFWLYIHLVFLGAFSSGMFSAANMSQFWPLVSDVSVYDITEFMIYTGPPLFFIILYGLTRNEISEADELAYEQARAQARMAERGGASPRLAEPTRIAEPVYNAVPVREPDIEPMRKAVPISEPSPVTPAADLAAHDPQELLRMVQRQQERIEKLDAELQSLRNQMKTNTNQPGNSL